jgi:hypothetical protein
MQIRWNRYVFADADESSSFIFKNNMFDRSAEADVVVFYTILENKLNHITKRDFSVELCCEIDELI